MLLDPEGSPSITTSYATEGRTYLTLFLTVGNALRTPPLPGERARDMWDSPPKEGGLPTKHRVSVPALYGVAGYSRAMSSKLFCAAGQLVRPFSGILSSCALSTDGLWDTISQPATTSFVWRLNRHGVFPLRADLSHLTQYLESDPSLI